MKWSLLLAIIVVALATLHLASGDEERDRPRERQLVELSGRLVRPVKWTPQLDVFPSGVVKRFDLRGPLLDGVRAGTPIYVRGVVHSELHRGGTKDNLSPFPPQWMIWLEVTELKVLSDPQDVLKSGVDSKPNDGA